MKSKPAEHKLKFREEWDKAVNRFVREFTVTYCAEDGAIDWEKLLVFNSGRNLGRKGRSSQSDNEKKRTQYP